jgi:soluble lytic murein transglycosylase-like protein
MRDLNRIGVQTKALLRGAGDLILRLRAPALAVLALVSSLPVSSPGLAQALRPTLSAAPISPKERVTVSVAGSASIALVTAQLPIARSRPGRRADYEAMVAMHARANGVPEDLVHRVIVRESKYQPNLIGRGGTIGMMQIKLATARGVGYTGTSEGLLDPQTNLTWAVKYLAGAWRAAQGNADLAVRKYAAGYYERRGRNTASR